MKAGRYLLFAKMPSIDAGLLLSAGQRDDNADMLKLSKARQAALVAALEDSRHSEIETIQVNGRPAWRYEVFGKRLHERASGIDLAYVVTLIDEGTEMVEIKVFSNKESFTARHDDLAKIANNINFTKPNLSELNAAAKEPAPPNEQTAAFLAVAAKAKALVQALCSKPDYAILYAKSSCNANEITFNQLSDSTKITAEQKPLLLAWGGERDALTKQIVDQFNNEGGTKGKAFADLLSTEDAAGRKLRLAFIKGDLTWGELNQQRLALTKKSVDEARSIAKRPESAEPPATVSAPRKSASDRLRDLQALYKDGVITKKDYETKKKEILDAM